MLVHAIIALCSAAGYYKWMKDDNRESLEWIIVHYGLIVLFIYSVAMAVLLPIISSNQIIIGIILFISLALCTTATVLSVQKVHYKEYFVKKNTEHIALEQGKVSVIFELKIANSIQFYMKELQKNKTGLCITRTKPDLIKQQYNTITGDIKWLTAEEGASLTPTDLEEISYAIMTFIEKNKGKAVVLFDGFSFLVNYHDFNKIIHMFSIIKDKVSKEQAIMIMPIAEKALDKASLRMIKTEFMVI